MARTGGETTNPYIQITPDPSVIDGQIPLIYENYISNTYTYPPPLLFDDRYPSEDTFQPQNDPFVDRFYFSSYEFDYMSMFGAHAAADGGRFDHFFA